MPTEKNANDANHEARPVKEIIEAAKTIRSNVSVRDALEEMRAQKTDSSLVTNKSGKLLGRVSTKEMNRNVGGFGHDPKTESVKGQVKTNKADCFEDQTIAEAKQIMHDSNTTEVPVMTRERLLLGKTNLQAIARRRQKKTQERRKRGRQQQRGSKSTD
ncbi:MAG: CBS domain-containing protein [Chthoniobacterales bacterium]